MTSLTTRHCVRIARGSAPLAADACRVLLAQLPEWSLRDSTIEREFRFDEYAQTLAFVNAAGWIAQREEHHPDMHVSYNKCIVRYTTHAANGLTENDFICAAKIDALLA